MMHDDLKILLTEQQIQRRVTEMGAEITRDFRGQNMILIGVLKGACLFLSDLARKIELDVTFDFIAVASYGAGTKQSGEVRLIKSVDRPMEGQNIILVEDILDTGYTITFLKNLFATHQPRALKVAALLDKPSRRIQPVAADYIGFSIPNEFVVGYGLDFAERYRNLSDIRILPAHLVPEETPANAGAAAK